MEEYREEYRAWLRQSKGAIVAALPLPEYTYHGLTVYEAIRIQVEVREEEGWPWKVVSHA